MSEMLLASLRFAGDLPAWGVSLMALIAVMVVLWLYLRETQTIRPPYQYLLPALRATAVAMVVFILAGPVWHHRQVIGTLGRVVFAIDTSRSMSLSDSRSAGLEDSRLQRATRFLLGTETQPGWLEEISSTHAVDVVVFDSGNAVSVWSSDDGSERPTAFDLAANGKSTSLSAPLESVLATMNLDSQDDSDELPADQVDSIRRSAVVLMTDGRDTGTSSDPTRTAPWLAKRLATAGTTVNAIGMGSVEETPDVGIVEVIRPETVSAQGKLAGEVIVQRSGNQAIPATITIESAGNAVWQKTVPMDDKKQVAVPYEIDVGTLLDSLDSGGVRGIHRMSEILQLVARVDAGANDTLPENNLVDFRVAASTRNRRLLIIDSSSRWETRYLKNLFARDPAWDTDVVLFGPGTAQEKLPRGDQAGQFPETDMTLSRYDAILMGEVDSSQLTVEDRGLLSRFVATGGGLVIIDGRFGNIRSLSRTEFGALMPVRFGTSGGTSKPDRLQITADGIDQPAMGLVDQSDQLESFWKLLPPPKWIASSQVAEGAEVWARAVFDNGGSAPWLATRMYGAGRVFYFASDQTWRWRYKVADRFHARFWNQLVVAAMEPPFSASDQFVSIGTDKVEYQHNQAIAVRARLRDVRGNPVSTSFVEAIVMHQGSPIAAVPLEVDDPSRGTFAGRVGPLPAGEYNLRIRASGYDESAMLASTKVWVVENNRMEMQRPSLDEDSLRQIAAAGEGRYVHESDGQTILELLKPLSSGTVNESDTVLWQSYYWFCPIIVLLTLEWWCRKRAGLV